MKIDLAQKNEVEKYSSPEKNKNEPYYPCMYLSNLESEEGLSVGDKVMIHGVVKSVSMNERDQNGKVKKNYSIEVEGRDMETSGKMSSQTETTSKRDEKAVDEGLTKAEKAAEEKQSKKQEKY